MQITASVRLARSRAEVEVFTRIFGALPSGRRELVAWLLEHRVTAAVMEATGVYWEAPFEALEDAGIPALLMNAQQVNQIRGRKTDIGDSAFLANICGFGPGSPGMIPPARFRRLRKVSRLRQELVGDSAGPRNRIHKVLDASGIRIGGVLSDVFGINGAASWKGSPPASRRKPSSPRCRPMSVPISGTCRMH